MTSSPFTVAPLGAREREFPGVRAPLAPFSPARGLGHTGLHQAREHVEVRIRAGRGPAHLDANPRFGTNPGRTIRVPRKKLPDNELFSRIRLIPETGEAFWRGGKLDGKRAGGRNSQGYCVLNIAQRHYRLHHLIWRFVHGYWPSEIDHIDGNRLNNRIDNLRECTRSENQKNRGIPPGHKTGVLGVSYVAKCKRWRAHIGARSVAKNLGLFNTFEEAVAARRAAEQQYGYHPNHGKREATCGL